MKLAKIKAKENNDYSELKKIAFEHEKSKIDLQKRLTDIYVEIIGGEREFTLIAKRINKVVDQEILKFIYVLREDESVIVDKELIKGNNSQGRAAHSELAQGRNVYGAGELVYCRYNNVFIIMKIGKTQ